MKNITAKEFIKILPNLDSGSVIVDVRETDEFKERHIENSINFPLSTIGKNLPKLKEYKTIYLICESGARSRYAHEILKTADINTIDITEGLNLIEIAGIKLISEEV